MENIDSKARKVVEKLIENADFDDDSDVPEDEPKDFYVTIGNFVGKITKQGLSKWHEVVIKGKAPYNFGSKTYQSYLTPKDVMQWLKQDYKGIKGPFSQDEI